MEDTLGGHTARVSGRRNKRLKSITDILCPVAPTTLRRELEKFRVEWEKTNGPTDLTRNYTSMWSDQNADSLLLSDPQKYYDGLPPFVQAYLHDMMKEAGQQGELDYMDPRFLQVFVSGGMNRHRHER